ncbi:MAG: hypothetical protein LBV17_08425, partial [Treponema sp.]|nr:hypothetical protein [Treponema sp.]
MVFAVIYFVISLFLLFQGIFQIIGKNQRSALNWHFLAICAIFAISFFNNAILFYVAFLEGVDPSESSYTYNKLIMIFSVFKIMGIPFFFAFVRSLSKLKSKR